MVTDESELLPQENYLDLVINTAALDKSRLAQLLGNRDILPGAVQTFMFVDFYNHDTVSSATAEGFEPVYNA